MQKIITRAGAKKPAIRISEADYDLIAKLCDEP